MKLQRKQYSKEFIENTICNKQIHQKDFYFIYTKSKRYHTYQLQKVKKGPKSSS